MSAQYGALRSSDLVDSQVIKVKSRGMDQRVRANRAKDHFSWRYLMLMNL